MPVSNPIRIFDQSLNLITELDDYASAYFTRSWSGVGSFSIQTNWNTTHADELQMGRIVLFGGDVKKCGIITDLARDIGPEGKGSQTVMATGVELKGILGWRVVPPYSGNEYYQITNSAETVMKTLVSENGGPTTADADRKFALLEIDADADTGDTYLLKTRWTSTVLDQLSDCSLATGMGYYIYLDLSNKKMKFATASGLDRSASQSVNPRAIFSSDYDTLKSASLKNSDANYRNLAYVGGQGEGVERTISEVFIDSSEPTGMARREVFIDARDIAATSDLAYRGGQELEALSTVLTIDGSALAYSPLVYGTDYNLGDIVTLSAYDTSVDVRITEVTESWAPLDYQIDLAFDRLPQTIQSQVQTAVGGIRNALASTGVDIPVTVTGNYTVSDSSRSVIVNTANAVTVTIDAGLPVGSTVTIQRLVASTNAITVARSGSETIEGGTSFVIPGSGTLTAENSIVTLQKVTSTAWKFVAGIISGSNSNGSWIKYADGTMVQWDNDTGPLASGATTITMPSSFVDTSYAVVCNTIPNASYSWSLAHRLTGNTIIIYDANAGNGKSWMAIGRWRA